MSIGKGNDFIVNMLYLAALSKASYIKVNDFLHGNTNLPRYFIVSLGLLHGPWNGLWTHDG